MKMRKTVAILTAVCAVFAFAGMAMAENRVEVKVTSEPIGYQAACDKAGGFSLEFDSNTVIASGDRITIDLSYTNPSDFASICKKIDFEVSNGGSGGLWANSTIGLSSASPFYYTGVGPAAADNGGIYFRVYGDVATQRITIDVLGGGSVTVGADPDSKIILVLLDQKTNPIDFTSDPGIYVDDTLPADNVYDVAATPGQNTLCINVSSWSGSVVKGNMDSLADKYTFIPSDPQIAHIAPAGSYAFAYCAKEFLNPGRISCGSVGEFNGVVTETCQYFDYETGAGYIFGTRGGTNRIMIQGSNTFDSTFYQVQLEILVNGVAGDNGVYFSSDILEANGYDSLGDACNATVTAGDDGPLTNVGIASYYDGSGSPLNAANLEAPHVNQCDVASSARATKLMSAESNLGVASTNRVLVLDIPIMNYDLGVSDPQDVVTVSVKLIKAPCGTIFEGDRIIGTMCAAPPPEPAATLNTLVYPYFTAMDNDNWWDGLVITNLDAAEGEFTVIIYEQDGDVGAFTGTVDANSLYQNTLKNELNAGAQMLVNTGSGVLGDSLCYLIVCTDFTADGFGFMGSLSQNSLMANESMGYIPRVDYYNANDMLTFCNSLGVVAGEIPTMP